MVYLHLRLGELLYIYMIEWMIAILLYWRIGIAQKWVLQIFVNVTVIPIHAIEKIS